MNFKFKELNSFHTRFNQRLLRFKGFKVISQNNSSNTAWAHINGRDDQYQLFMRFKKFKFKRKESNHHIDVLIHGLITLSNDGFSKYITRVSYSKSKYQTSPNKQDLVAGMHYDYTEKTEIWHPVFHVQNDISVLREEQVELFDIEIDNDTEISSIKNNQLKDIRVPTTQMDIYSTIIMVLADNYFYRDSNVEKEDKEKFIDLLNFTITENVLKIDCSRFSSNLNSHSSLHHSTNEVVAPCGAEWYSIIAKD